MPENSHRYFCNDHKSEKMDPPDCAFQRILLILVFINPEYVAIDAIAIALTTAGYFFG